ncbi:MAG: RNA methyltransferase [Amoebophilaceae bacterium]|jgi:TrmH family RNA methyltransferase|nr:RNA methyltransferase [Amoebophilaceae bacterium]
MCVAPLVPFQRLPSKQAKFIKSLHLKKYRQQEKVFIVEGAKNVLLLLASHYTVRMIVGTPVFLATHDIPRQGDTAIFQAKEDTLASIGTLTTNKAVLAVAQMPAHTLSAPTGDIWGLVLDNIRDPGNLGTMVRIADWYNIPALICSPSTVDLYNPKVLHASMGSFTRVQVYYTPLATFLSNTSWPILGTFTTGDNIHCTSLPFPGLIVVGNESQGISPDVLPYIQQRISIPRYGQAESLNAAVAAAIVCDHWQRQRR